MIIKFENNHKAVHLAVAVNAAMLDGDAQTMLLAVQEQLKEMTKRLEEFHVKPVLPPRNTPAKAGWLQERLRRLKSGETPEEREQKALVAARETVEKYPGIVIAAQEGCTEAFCLLMDMVGVKARAFRTEAAAALGSVIVPNISKKEQQAAVRLRGDVEWPIEAKPNPTKKELWAKLGGVTRI